MPGAIRQASELNRRGDLLMAVGHAWNYGDTYVDYEDFDTATAFLSRKTEVGVTRLEFLLGKCWSKRSF